MLVNFAAAVLIRQQTVLNVLYGLAGRGSRTWPLWLRWSLSKVHHVGGVHAGAALAGTFWLAAFARAARDADATTRALAYALVALALIVVGGAAPTVRRRAHNVFETDAPLRRVDGDRAVLGARAARRRRHVARSACSPC